MPTFVSKTLNPIEQIPGILVHYDASDRRTITFGSGSLVAGLADISANQNGATQVPGNQPTFIDPLSNKAGLDLDGNKFMNFDNPLTITGDYSAVFVTRNVADTFFIGGVLNTIPNLNSGSNAFYNYQDDGGSFDNITLGDNPTGPLIQFITRDGAGAHKMFLNGVDITVAHNSDSSSPLDFTVIGRRSGDASFSRGQFTEVIIWGRELATSERQSADASLSNKYGVSI